MFDVTPETKLPRLNSSLQLTRGQSDGEGTPVWRLYDPVAHQYYQIGWMEFEYVSRFSLYSTYGELEVALIQQTTLQPDKETFRELILFLHQ